MSNQLDLAAAEAWVRSVVGPFGQLEPVKDRPWATVLRADVAGEPVWFKACRPVQAFEPRLTAELFGRWPDRVARVLAHDPERAWLLTADAGAPIGDLGNSPEIWLRALPLYAEIQRGESEHGAAHVANGVPDLRMGSLAAHYDELLGRDLPLEDDEVQRLRRFARTFTGLCDDLAASGRAATLQHDDLHVRSIFVHDDRIRILDWGDTSIAHPFFSLVVTFQFLEEENGLVPDDPWFTRLRDAYLEPWGSGAAAMLDLALRVGTVAHAFAWIRHRDAMVGPDRADFDVLFARLLRRIIERAVDGGR